MSAFSFLFSSVRKIVYFCTCIHRMSNHKRKEQIMAIFFNRVQRVNPRDPKGARKWYPVLKSNGKVSTRRKTIRSFR